MIELTEKRFTYLDASNTHYIGSFFCNGVPLTNKECVDLLNELHEENKNLKDFAQHNYSETKKIINNLQKENEQLKQFKSKVFNLLQDEIREESELLDYYLKEKAPCNADRQQIIIGVLKRLQKEL